MDTTNVLNVLISQVDDLDLSVDGVDTPAHELLLKDFELSRLLSIIAFSLDLNDSEDKGFFEELRLTPRKDLVKKINAVIQFDVKAASGQRQIFTADMRKSGRIYKGKVDGLKPDVSVACSDADAVALAKGQSSPQKAFLTGKLKVKGKLMAGLNMQNILQQEVGKLSKL